MKPAIGFLLPLAVMLAACSNEPAAPLTGQARADAATVSACRDRGEAVYESQNRDAIYTATSGGRDTPYSANYTPLVLDRGLSQRYGYDQTVRNCIRNTGTQPIPASATPTASGPAASAPATAPGKP
jgi:hypothetical protein